MGLLSSVSLPKCLQRGRLGQELHLGLHWGARTQSLAATHRVHTSRKPGSASDWTPGALVWDARDMLEAKHLLPQTAKLHALVLLSVRPSTKRKQVSW